MIHHLCDWNSNCTHLSHDSLHFCDEKQKVISALPTFRQWKWFVDLFVLIRAVASLTVPGGQEFHFSHFSSSLDQVFWLFLKLFSFSSSFWPSGWASCPPRKALATPLVLIKPMCFSVVCLFVCLFFNEQWTLFNCKKCTKTCKRQVLLQTVYYFLRS